MNGSIGRVTRLIVGLAFALALTASAMPVGGPAAPADAVAATIRTGGAVVQFGDDIYVGPRERLESAVSFGGDIVVEGTIEHNAVSFGGDIDLRPGASVGTRMNRDDVTIISFGGSVIEAEEASVVGKTVRASGVDWTGEISSLPAAISFFGPQSTFGWGAGLAIWAVVGLLAVALAARQLRAVQRHLEEKPAVYLGWGALEAIVLFPLLTLFMIITIVGILAAIPWALIVVPLLFLFGYVAAAGLVGQRVIDAVGQGGEDLLLATIVGLAIFKIVDLIPIIGALALILVWLAGLGATVAAIWNWQRTRREGQAAQA